MGCSAEPGRATGEGQARGGRDERPALADVGTGVPEPGALHSPPAAGTGGWPGAGQSFCPALSAPGAAGRCSAQEWRRRVALFTLAEGGCNIGPGSAARRPQASPGGPGALRSPATGRLSHTHPVQGPDLQPEGTWHRGWPWVCLGLLLDRHVAAARTPWPWVLSLGHHSHGTACPASPVPWVQPLLPRVHCPPWASPVPSARSDRPRRARGQGARGHRVLSSPGTLPPAPAGSPASRALTDFDLRLRVSWCGLRPPRPSEEEGRAGRGLREGAGWAGSLGQTRPHAGP